MRTTRWMIAAAVALAGACSPSQDEQQSTARLTPSRTVEMPGHPAQPLAEKRPHELTAHGETRIDEYYWLRDDSRSDPEILAYLEAENRYLAEVMAPLKPLEDRIFEEIRGRIAADDESVPFWFNGYWYYRRFEPGKEYAIHARRSGSMDAEEEFLFDENERAAGPGFYELRAFEISDDHRYIVLAEDYSGRRTNRLSILETATGTFLPEQITGTSDALALSADGRYLFYHALDPQTLLDDRLMRHELGTDPALDVLAYEERDKTFYSTVYRSRSRDYIFLFLQHTDTTEVRWLPADRPLEAFQPFVPRAPGHDYQIDHADGRFYIRSNWEAPNFRVFTAGTPGSKASWQELIPHRDTEMVTDLQALDDYLLLEERRNGLLQVRIRAHDGSLDRYLQGEGDAWMMQLGDNRNTDTTRIRYSYSNLVTPWQQWELDIATGETRLLKADRVPDYDSDLYATRRMEVTARDGESVPVTLAWRRETPPSPASPALVYGYGAYGYSEDPYFYHPIFSLLDRGFVYVIAHVRGGQEKGRRWYESGRLLNKKNSFTDFIDVTEGLQAQGLIDPKRSFAAGISAGGLLMGAVVNMAPELYLGAIVDVPFVDVITTMLDDSIPLTSGEWREWGDPRIKQEYDYMLSYSPYDQITAQDYPNLFVTTGLHDSQVQYFEPAKWVARLRDRRTDDNMLVLRVNMEAGHGGESGRFRVQRETAQEYAFMAHLAGIEE